jgi:hypothetical protein
MRCARPAWRTTRQTAGSSSRGNTRASSVGTPAMTRPSGPALSWGEGGGWPSTTDRPMAFIEAWFDDVRVHASAAPPPSDEPLAPRHCHQGGRGEAMVG